MRGRTLAELNVFETGEGASTQDSKTGAAVFGAASNVVDMPGVKRTRGRPRGSRNKVTREVRDLLAADGPKMIASGLRTLWRFAEGKPIYTPRNKNGIREKLVPDAAQAAAAARALTSGLIPLFQATLKAVELTGAAGTPLFNTASLISDPRDLALAYGHREAARQFLERAGIDPDGPEGQAAVAKYEASVAVSVNGGAGPTR